MKLIVPEALKKTDNVHRDALKEFFGDNYYQKTYSGAGVKFLFLCFTNRCGSNFLAELLSSTKKLNRGDEVYNAGTITDNSKDHRLASPCAFVERVVNNLAKSQTFVSKVAVEQLAILTEIGLLDEILGQSHFVMLRRSDVLRQAISLALALKTDKWSSTQSNAKADKEIRFDHQLVTSIIQYLVSQNNLFDLFFAENGLAPLYITYEALMQHSQHYVDQISALLQVGPLQVDMSDLTLKRQSNQLNEEWRQRYLSSL